MNVTEALYRELFNDNLEREDLRRLGKVLKEAEMMVCPGYGVPDNGFVCGKEKDYDRPWCDDCQASADLDERNGENDPDFIYPHLLN